MSDTLKRLWEHLCDWCGKKAFCWWSQERMAEALGWTLRKLRDVMAKLKAAGWVRIQQRGCGLTAYYYVARSEDELFPHEEKPVDNRQLKLAFDIRPVSCSLTPAMAPLVMEELETEATPSALSRRTVEEHAETDSPFSPIETQAITRHVEGCGLPVTSELLTRLARKARYFKTTGFRIASAIDRAWRKVKGTSNAPQSPGWIVRVVENELAAASQPTPIPTPPESAPRYEQPPDYIPPFDIHAIANLKRMRV